MTGTCALCHEMIVGASAPAASVHPIEWEWRELGAAAQSHFVQHHPEEYTGIQILAAVFVHYLLSLQLLFTSDAAITLQDGLHGDLLKAIDAPRAGAVIDVAPASVVTLEQSINVRPNPVLRRKRAA